MKRGEAESGRRELPRFKKVWRKKINQTYA